MTQQLNRLAQTKAIVAQVEQEIAHRAAHARHENQSHTAADMTLLSPVNTGPSLPARAARRVVLSLFPAGL